MRVAFAGTPEFALPALEALRTQHEVVGVLTRPDSPSGRGRRLTPSPIKTAALAHHLPLVQPPTLADPAVRAQLAAWRPQALVVVAYGLRLPPELLSLPQLGCLNIHASLLPRWRGAAPIQRAILSGDRETGVSIMQMDSGLDTGPILLQRRLGIRPDHTGGSLHDELATLGAEALLEAIAGLAEGTLHPWAQPSEGITCAPKIEKAEARVDWTLDAQAIERQVRAFNPWPVAETMLEGEQLRIFVARTLPAEQVPPAPRALPEAADRPIEKFVENIGKNDVPGVIIAVRDDSMWVRCGSGTLEVTEVQRPGRRLMSVGELSRGLRLLGRRLG